MSLRWQGEFVSKSKCCRQECVRAVENNYLFKVGLCFPTQKCVRFFKLIATLFLSLERKSVLSGCKLKWKEIGVRGFWWYLNNVFRKPSARQQICHCKGWSGLSGSAKSRCPTGKRELLPGVGNMPCQGLHTPAGFSVVGVGAYKNRN